MEGSGGRKHTHTHTFREGKLWRTNFVIHFFGIYLGGNSDTLASMRMYLDDFFGMFVVVVFVWLWVDSAVRLGGYLPWSVVDDFGQQQQQQQHSFDGGGGCSIGSRYVNVRRDLPRLLFFVPFFLPNIRIQVVGFLENSFSLP